MGEYTSLSSEIRKLCREFDDKLPSKMSDLKTLPAYAEKLIMRYPNAEKASKTHSYCIWNGQ